MINYTAKLIPNQCYHVYNHAVGLDNFFKTDENYYFFLKKYINYILPIADTFAYCLLPNHFHFIIKIKDEKEIISFFKEKKQKNIILKNLSQFLSQQFSNCFNAYTKSFNKLYNRKGNLFQRPRPFKKIHIDSDDYFRNTINYIHFNPIHHGFVENLLDWKFSSYESFFSQKTSHLKKEEVFKYFDGKEHFYAFHQEYIDLPDLN